MGPFSHTDRYPYSMQHSSLQPSSSLRFSWSGFCQIAVHYDSRKNDREDDRDHDDKNTLQNVRSPACPVPRKSAARKTAAPDRQAAVTVVRATAKAAATKAEAHAAVALRSLHSMVVSSVSYSV